MPRFYLSKDDLEDIRANLDDLPDHDHINKLISTAIVQTEWDNHG